MPESSRRQKDHHVEHQFFKNPETDKERNPKQSMRPIPNSTLPSRYKISMWCPNRGIDTPLIYFFRNLWEAKQYPPQLKKIDKKEKNGSKRTYSKPIHEILWRRFRYLYYQKSLPVAKVSFPSLFSCRSKFIRDRSHDHNHILLHEGFFPFAIGASANLNRPKRTGKGKAISRKVVGSLGVQPYAKAMKTCWNKQRHPRLELVNEAVWNRFFIIRFHQGCGSLPFQTFHGHGRTENGRRDEFVHFGGRPLRAQKRRFPGFPKGGVLLSRNYEPGGH